MKKPMLIILIALMIAGVVTAYFSDVEMADYISLAVAFGSAGVLCANLVAKSTKKDWKVYVSMACIGLSAFLLGFCGVSTDTMSKLITGIVGVIVLIVGIVTAVVSTSKTKTD